jgi:glycyl-tRNA synthetase
LAPVKAAVLPVVKKDGLAEKAKKIYDDLKLDVKAIYEDKDTIGRRYTRQDLIGTPFCIAVDYDTMQDDTVTIRHRDTMEQERVSIAELKQKIRREVSMKRIFEKL